MAKPFYTKNFIEQLVTVFNVISSSILRFKVPTLYIHFSTTLLFQKNLKYQFENFTNVYDKKE